MNRAVSTNEPGHEKAVFVTDNPKMLAEALRAIETKFIGAANSAATPKPSRNNTTAYTLPFIALFAAALATGNQILFTAAFMSLAWYTLPRRWQEGLINLVYPLFLKRELATVYKALKCTLQQASTARAELADLMSDDLNKDPLDYTEMNWLAEIRFIDEDLALIKRQLAIPLLPILLGRSGIETDLGRHDARIQLLNHDIAAYYQAALEILDPEAIANYVNHLETIIDQENIVHSIEWLEGLLHDNASSASSTRRAA